MSVLIVVNTASYGTKGPARPSVPTILDLAAATARSDKAVSF